MDALQSIGIDPEMDAAWFKSAPESSVIATFQQQVLDSYAHKSGIVSDRLLPVIKDVHAREGQRYKRIVVPFTDGVLGLNISADMEEAIRTDGRSIMHDVEKVATLALIDDAWKEHLRNIDDLKESVQGASFEQKDPLVIYKMEAYNLFEGLIGHINSNVTSFLLKGSLMLQDEQGGSAPRVPAPNDAMRRAQANRLRTTNQDSEMTETQEAAQRAASSAGQGNRPIQKTSPIVMEKITGRNDPCPCGSGKKFKNCHGR
jgi:preprotein translocase subunit SecA